MGTGDDELEQVDDELDDQDDGGDAGGDDEGGEDDALDAIKSGFASLGTQLEKLVKSGKGDTVTPRAADDGAGVEDQVRRALERVGKEKETDERVAKLEKLAEKPPRKQSRLERALWGKVDV